MPRSLAARMAQSPVGGVGRVGGVTGVEEPGQRVRNIVARSREAGGMVGPPVSLKDVQADPRAHLKQQPSLFDIRQVKPKPELRYAARGYTPERMRAVREATTGLVNMPGLRTSHQQFGTGPSMVQSVDHPFYHPHGERMIHETIARSTMPTQHLEGIKGIELMGKRKLGQQSMAGTWGLYTPYNRMVRMFPTPAVTPKRGPDVGKRMIEPIGRSVTPSEIQRGMRGQAPPKFPKEMYEEKGSRGQRQAAEATLIHELGHHVSITSTQAWGGKGRMMENPLEEARADRYMLWHWRPHPGDVRAGQNIDIGEQTYVKRMKGFGPYDVQDLQRVGRPPQKPPMMFAGSPNLPVLHKETARSQKAQRSVKINQQMLDLDNV